MRYLISTTLILVLIPIFSTQATEQKAVNPVPHNNGTIGLLKHTYIDPIENFNSTSNKTTQQKVTDESPPELTTEEMTNTIDNNNVKEEP